MCSCLFGKIVIKLHFWDQIKSFKIVFENQLGTFLLFEIHFLKFVCKIPCLNYIQIFFLC